MEPGAPEVRNMSTAEILRGIVAEKLTTAAQEIVAVLERTVAGYEEEASGLRQEIDRQRRQLEAVLQLEIKLEPADDQFPVCGPAAGGGQLPAEEAQHKNDQSVGDSRSMGLHCYTEVQMEEDEEEDQDQEHLSEPDYEVASRLSTPTLQSDRRSAGRPQISESQEHIDLRICILEDSRIKVLSVHVYQKYPVHEVRCPRGLQEADFLDLLRSTFPQLAAEKPFDVFICQRSKKLQPLKVKTLTPEEICQSTSLTGKSAIYIRLKNQAEELTSTEEIHPPQRSNAVVDSPSNPYQTSLLSPRVQSDRSMSSRPQINEPQNHIDLRICILDSHINLLSSRVYKKNPVQELQCPGGLQEADFLDLLRSTFPKLAAQKEFDFFTTDLRKKLEPLKVETVTPEEIFRTISSSGRSALYIRLKNTSFQNQAEELMSTEEEFNTSQRNDAAADFPSTPDQTSLLLPRVQSDRSRSSIPWISEPQNHVDLRICILDSQIDVLSTKVYRKYPVMELQCRGGLQEADFLDLLRSTFPQLAAQKDFDFFTTDLRKKLQPLKIKTLTPEEIWRIISSTGSSAVYIRPKNTSFGNQAEELKSTEEDFHPSQRNDAAADSPSTPDQTSLLLARVRNDTKKPSRLENNEPQNHIDLRICILDSQIDVLSINVYKKYPVQRVQCPCGLQEADFLDLLRSTFPKLADQKDFDFFTTDRKKKLEPLKVEKVTPKEIWRTISNTGYSALYIRLKQSEFQARQKEPKRKDAAYRVQLYRSRSRRVPKLQNRIDLRICILEDPQVEALSSRVYKKYPVLLLQCPRGLQEMDFVDLLRSTFPQLAGQNHLDFFTADLKKRLHRLKVKKLTPEKICRTISSTGHSALYIRLRQPAEARERAPQRKDAATDSPSTDQPRLNMRDQSDSSRSDRPQVSEPQKHVDLRVCVLEDSQLDVLSTRVYTKYPVLELQFPVGLQELDFLDLLRSTFPQLAAQKDFDFFTTDLKKRLQPLEVETVTPEEISRSIRHSALYIRLKAQEEVRSDKEELRHADAAKDSSSTSDQTSLNTSSSRLEHDEDMETEDTDDEDGGRSESAGLPVLSEDAGDGDEVSDDDRKQDKSEKHLRESEPEETTRKKRVKTKRRKLMKSPLKASADNGDAFLSCKVCRAPRTSKNMLIKHAWRHVDDPKRVCGVCGEQLESVEKLRSHLQSHQKTHRCNICGKSFLSSNGLSGHVARHKGKKPYECNICHKAFAQNWVLNHHMWVHEADRPHKCDICQKSFYSKVLLTRHKAGHTGETLHRCDTCGKSLSSLESLSQHILRHSAKKAEFACEICSRTFNTNQKLKLHRRSHRREELHVCSKCSKGFSSSSMLAAHMRVHTGEKPYKCSVCDKAFNHKHCMKRHMATHHVESDLCKTEAQILSDRINGATSVEPVL